MDQHAEGWIVVLEVDHDPSMPEAGQEILQNMVALLGTYKATVRYDDHRYSVQLEVPAPALAEAASLAVLRWAEAAAAVGLPTDGLVRAEVLTPAELEQSQARSPAAVDEQPPASPRSAALSVQDASMEDALLRRAFCDPLTGLAGHGLLTAHVERALAEGQAGRVPVALMFADFDVAAYGRRHGPAAVDDLVGAVGAWLPTAVRGTDTTARVGPHTFGVLMECGSVAMAVHLAESVLAGSAVLLDVAGGESIVSVGVAVATEPEYAAERLFAEAEAALATARSNGGGFYKVFVEAADNDIPTVTDRASTLPATAGSPAGPPDRELYLPLLGRVATVAGECDSLEDAVRTVLHQVRAVIRWPVGCLWVRPPGTDVVVASEVWSLVSPQYQSLRDATSGVTSAMGDGAVGEALASRRVVCVPDLSAFADAHAAAALDAGLVALVAVPIVVEAEVVAVLELLSDRILEHDHERLAVLATVGTQLGRAAERGRPGRRSVARAQDILGVAAAVTEGVVACDADGSIRVWNWGAERTFGYSRDEALGRPLELVLPDLLVVDPAAAKAWDRGRVVNPGRVVIATRRDGTRIPVWAAVVSREPSGSRPTTVVVSALSQRTPGNWPGSSAPLQTVGVLAAGDRERAGE